MRRFAAIIFMTAFILILMPGCEKPQNIYVFDFVEEANLSNDEGSWYAVHDSILFGDQGAYAMVCEIAAPFFFSGDYTCDLHFYNNAIDERNISELSLILADGRWDYDEEEVENLVKISLLYFPSMDACQVVEMKRTEELMIKEHSYSLTIPGLAYEDDNFLRIIKSGNQYRCYLNDTHLVSFTPSYIDTSVPLCPNIACIVTDIFSADREHGIFLKELMVSYKSGNIQAAPWN